MYENMSGKGASASEARLQEFDYVQDKHKVAALSTCHPGAYISEAERQR